MTELRVCAATIVETDNGQANDGPANDGPANDSEASGWIALTDHAVSMWVPAASLDGVLMLRPGQRVRLEVNADEVVVRTTIG